MRKTSIIAFALIALAAALWALRTPDTDPAAMAEKYASDASRFVENAAGLRVHYRDEGNPDGQPIVFVHGTSGSLHNWIPLVDRLGKDYRIITYTQPGHGLTGPHPRDDYSFAGMAEALDLVAGELGVERFALAGHSMGGWVAWRYALAHPDRIDALILIDASGAPLPEGEKPAAPPLAFRLAQTPAGRFIMQHVTPRRLVEKTALDFVVDPTVMTEADVDRYWELLRYPGNRRAAALRMIADREPEYADRISEISAPALLIWGAEDKQTPVGLAASFDARLPDATVMIYDSVGHMPMEEAPDRTARDIDAFLQKTVNAVLSTQ